MLLLLLCRCPVLLLLLLLCRSLVFIWDSEALQLHGVFRVDSNARELPEREVPGNRPYQVGEEAVLCWGRV
jgi:hypothetical protein